MDSALSIHHDAITRCSAFIGRSDVAKFEDLQRAFDFLSALPESVTLMVRSHMDHLFYFTLLVIFLSALAGVALKRRKRDRCLKNFSGQMVTLHPIRGEPVRGCLETFASGLELYLERQDIFHAGAESLIYYGDEFNQLQIIARAPGPHEVRAVRKAYTPLDHFLREGRNLLNTFQDAFQQTFGVILFRFKSNPYGAVLSKQEKGLTSLSNQTMDALANNYEPILEKYLGKRVVLEVVPIDDAQDPLPKYLTGVLHEYTRDWIELHCIDEAPFFDMDVILSRRLARLRFGHVEHHRLHAKNESSKPLESETSGKVLSLPRQEQSVGNSDE